MIWLAWTSAVAVSFAALETHAIVTKRPTLSRSVWTLSKAFPPFPAIFGLIVGFLACHFWWYGGYCPANPM